MKGLNSKYRPDVGETCLISPPHSDDENGYVFQEYKILWKSEVFVLYGVANCYPNLDKWDHVICKPLEA